MLIKGKRTLVICDEEKEGEVRSLEADSFLAVYAGKDSLA